MRKIIAGILILCLILAQTGCDNEEKTYVARYVKANNGKHFIIAYDDLVAVAHSGTPVEMKNKSDNKFIFEDLKLKNGDKIKVTYKGAIIPGEYHKMSMYNCELVEEGKETDISETMYEKMRMLKLID